MKIVGYILCGLMVVFMVIGLLGAYEATKVQPYKMVPIFSEGAWVRLSTGTKGYVTGIWHRGTPGDDEEVMYSVRYTLKDGQILDIAVKQWEIGSLEKEGDE